MPILLALPFPSVPYSEDFCEVYRSISFKQKRLENAGKAFFDLYERRVKKAEEDKEETEESEDVVNNKEKQENWRGKGRSRRSNAASYNKSPHSSFPSSNSNNNNNSSNSSNSGNLSVSKLKKLVEGECLYKRLNLTVDCKQEDIRKAYRKLAIIHHPDKNIKINEGNHTSKDKKECDAHEDFNSSIDDTFSKLFSEKDSKEAEKGKEQAAHAHFLKIQEAYEILSDVSYREQYDSAVPFDDFVPEVKNFYKNYKDSDGRKVGKENNEKNKQGGVSVAGNYIHKYLNKNKSENNQSSISAEEENLNEEQQQFFFDVFAPIFASNGRFSQKKPVLPLGEMSTSIEEVNKFYDFWFDFQSNRSFSIHDEFDLLDAESREEKRWMTRENLKIRRKHQKAEATRIRKLVENAYALDPRIRNNKMNQKKKKQEEKLLWQKGIMEEKLKKEKLLEEERKRQEEEEKKRKEDEKQISEEKQKNKVITKKWRQRLRLLCNSCSNHYVDSIEVQDICLTYDHSLLRAFCLEICNSLSIPFPWGESEAEEALLNGQKKSISIIPSEKQKEIVDEVIMKIIANLREMNTENKKKQLEKQKTIESTKQCERKVGEDLENKEKELSWTLFELSQLAKAIQRFPAGTTDRWIQVASFINTDKTPQQVAMKTKEMSQKNSVGSISSKLNDKAFENYVMENRNILKKIDVNPDQRDIAENMTFSSCNEVFQKNDSKSKNKDLNSKSRNNSNTENLQRSKENSVLKPKNDKNDDSEFFSNCLPSSSLQSSSIADKQSVDLHWTKQQQDELEKAIIRYPASMDLNERWSKIANDVNGKSKKECIQRFKQIRSAILASKEGKI